MSDLNKIRILTDSGCDITKEEEINLGIDILGFQIALDDKSYWERVDFTNEEFYDMIRNSDQMPVTSQIIVPRFEEKFLQYAEEGVEDVIVVLINSTGSQTHDNAILARKNIYEENPALQDKLRIHIIDSHSYSLSYGHAVMEAARKLKDGISLDDVIAYLENWFTESETYIIPFDLRHLKKSGRVSAAAAFLGELMGLKPVISLIDGKSEVIKKVRGDKAVINAALDIMAERMVDGGEYLLLKTTAEANADYFIEEATKRFGYPPAYVTYAGGVIATNTGPNILGVVLKGKPRSR